MREQRFSRAANSPDSGSRTGVVRALDENGEMVTPVVVTEAERLRNDAIASYQGNRNPFVDHPEWVACVYQSVCN